MYNSMCSIIRVISLSRHRMQQQTCRSLSSVTQPPLSSMLSISPCRLLHHRASMSHVNIFPTSYVASMVHVPLVNISTSTHCDTADIDVWLHSELPRLLCDGCSIDDIMAALIRLRDIEDIDSHRRLLCESQDVLSMHAQSMGRHNAITSLRVFADSDALSTEVFHIVAAAIMNPRNPSTSMDMNESDYLNLLYVVSIPSLESDTQKELIGFLSTELSIHLDEFSSSAIVALIDDNVFTGNNRNILYRAASHEIMERANDFTTQELIDILKRFGSNDLLDEDLCESASWSLAVRFHELNLLQRADALSLFESVPVSKSIKSVHTLFAAFAAIENSISLGRYTQEQIVRIASMFGKKGGSHHPSFFVALSSLIRRRIHRFDCDQLVKLVVACSNDTDTITIKTTILALLDELARQLAPHVVYMTCSDITKVVSVLSKNCSMDCQDTLTYICEHIENNVEMFTSKDLIDTIRHLSECEVDIYNLSSAASMFARKRLLMSDSMNENEIKRWTTLESPPFPRRARKRNGNHHAIRSNNIGTDF